MLNKLFKIVGTKTFSMAVIAILVIGIVFAVFWSIPPSSFPSGKIITVKEGSTLNDAALSLKQASLIKSVIAYKIYVVLLGGSKKIIAGDYLFSEPQTSLRIAGRMVRGDQGIHQIKVTILEGMATPDIGRLLQNKIPNFNYLEFMRLAKPNEGYLFPDTYFFYENVTTEGIVDIMRANFDKQIRKVSLAMNYSGRSASDIMKMASIVEKEAAKEEDRRIIAGILWKRMDNNYPLQVDAPFFYTLGKDSSKLTMSDLTSDSPYNLYTHKGLPPTPINNPGLDAIRATLNPIKTEYWFYLSDNRGVTHYAIDHQGHLANKDKYIQ